MSTALTIWTPPTLAARRRHVEPCSMFALDSPHLRFHLAFLASIKRGMVEQGSFPDLIEPRSAAVHVQWWQQSSVAALGRHVEMQSATVEQTAAIVVPVARRVDQQSDRIRWYPDGWIPIVAWAAAGGMGPEPRESSFGMRVIASASTSSERTRNLTNEERLDAEPIAPAAKLRIVQLNKPADAGPLFDAELPPLVEDLEAEICGERDPWEGF